MLFKKGNEYRIGFEMKDGEIRLTGEYCDIERCHYSPLCFLLPLNDLKKYGWTRILPPSLKDATGDELLVNKNGFYRRLLGRIGGYGDLATFAVSAWENSADSDDLKKACGTFTAYELKKDGYSFAPLNNEKESRKAELIRELTEMGAVKNGKIIE